MRKIIYLGYNGIANHRFQCSFPRSRLFSDISHLLVLKNASHYSFRQVYKFQVWKVTTVAVIHFERKDASAEFQRDVVKIRVIWLRACNLSWNVFPSLSPYASLTATQLIHSLRWRYNRVCNLFAVNLHARLRYSKCSDIFSETRLYSK